MGNGLEYIQNPALKLLAALLGFILMLVLPIIGIALSLIALPFVAIYAYYIGWTEVKKKAN